MEIIINKNKIYYTDDGKGFPIIFIPGITGKSEIWKNQIDELSIYYRVITLDFSKINIKNISIHDITDIINKFTDFLSLEYSFISGYSVGALFAVAFANRYPYKVAGVSTTSLGYISSSVNEITKFYYKNIIPKKNILLKFLNIFLNKNNVLDNKILKFASCLKQNTIKQEYDNLNHPLLIINGEFDNITVQMISDKVYKNNLKIRYEIIENSRKNCFNTDFGIYNTILNDFIKNEVSPM